MAMEKEALDTDEVLSFLRDRGVDENKLLEIEQNKVSNIRLHFHNLNQSIIESYRICCKIHTDKVKIYVDITEIHKGMFMI